MEFEKLRKLQENFHGTLLIIRNNNTFNDIYITLLILRCLYYFSLINQLDLLQASNCTLRVILLIIIDSLKNILILKICHIYNYNFYIYSNGMG